MEKIVVIGMGFIGGYLTPGYRHLLGETLRGQVFAIKATERGLEEKRREFPFAISVDDTAQVLEREHPTILVLSPPPTAVPGIARDILLPYFDRCRREGWPLPDLYTFAPDPPVTFFADLLGEGTRCVKILPNIVDRVGPVDMAPLGTNFVSIDERTTWPQERKEVLGRLLAPFGETVWLTDADSLLLLAGKITSHVCYEICYCIADRMAAGGQPVTLAQLGSGIRAAFRAMLPHPPQELLPCTLEELPPVLRPFLTRLVEAWYGGMMDYTRLQPSTLPPEQVEHVSILSFELNVFPIQVESREKLEQNTRNAATNGGVLEKGVVFFERYFHQHLADAVDALLAGRLEEDFFDLTRGMAYTVTLAAHRQSYRLTR